MADQTYRAYVCCGPNCGPRDSRALLDYLERELARLGLDHRVSVLPTGCQTHCETGPTMVVYPGPIYYQEVSIARLDRIIRDHFSGGIPVRDYFWTGLTRKELPTHPERDVLWRPEEEGGPPDPGPDGPAADAGGPVRHVAARRPRKAPPVDDFKW